MKKAARFIQLSDTHVLSDPAADAPERDPNESLRQVVARLCAHDGLDFVMITGDLIGDDAVSSYQVLRNLLAPLSVPIRVLPGNHDLRAGLRQELGPPPGRTEKEPDDAPYYYEFHLAGHRFLALDSQIPGEVPGRIDPLQFDWLRQRLSTHPEMPTIAFVHHPPAATGVAWLDEHRIENGDELLGLLARGNCQRVFFGHVHMPITLSISGVTCSSGPSTCYAFSDGIGAARMGGLRPGFQVVEAGSFGVRSYVEYL